MSGGSLDYFCYSLENHADDFGDKELKALVHDLAELYHDREWYLSGDTGLKNWIASKAKFKKKWLSGGTDKILKGVLTEYIREMMEAYGITAEEVTDEQKEDQ